MEKTQNQMGIMTAKKTDRKRQKKEYKGKHVDQSRMSEENPHSSYLINY